ncbi:2-C-methyl-D-erythritol 4-phosphate cytidylyltransferase [Oceanisphaera psychrotolerans]|uniref:2-C-methyl-D-erythritol 4-phosphate cytidylyltransferase n=1 Tax=Oceanisphaera psychrotolerans TaxID=1414654 RepID=A0A1J4QF98_9GAMM|nr:2-C-methyl-D-erythritol 4-phosphate cytidylyltransferase [Oceanisphaera psychrotolerans]OIN12451.1 2-C-methyl-D-erythritol 4-phosphate cytidylyltransferase [Oceanisphaera psychrotolerans]
MSDLSFTAVVPAAGIGSRMAADIPKQYLSLGGRTVLEQTLARLLDHPAIGRIIVATAEQDPWFEQLAIARHPRILRVTGGRERADSVLNALAHVETDWVLVHDAARPCLHRLDLDAVLAAGQQPQGAVLACRVRDTMKRGDGEGAISTSVSRDELWHALTPQCFATVPLRQVLSDALAAGCVITDEASAMEWAGFHPRLVEGRADNIKITRPEDLGLAGFFLQQMNESKI